MMAPVSTPTISLLTDFGNLDHYAGVMKGVILRICPGARIVDISHEVQAFQVAQGAYLLSQAWPWFPDGTVHVAVVDPGVGGHRRALAARARQCTFVLPDNGLLSLLGADTPQVREISNPALLLHPVSRTFHGRDVFAPAAAALANGFPFEQVGPEVEDWVRRTPGENAVLHIDRFGNIVTSLRAKDFRAGTIRLGSVTVSRRACNYAAAANGELFLIEGSGGYLEISEREASAAARIGCRVGDPITLEPNDKS